MWWLFSLLKLWAQNTWFHFDIKLRYLQINICATGVSSGSCNVRHKSRPGKLSKNHLWIPFVSITIISVELYQVHPIPYHQSPLTMLLREPLSVERMRQTKVVDEKFKVKLKKYWPLSRSCWWEVSLHVWRTSTAQWRHWGRLGNLLAPTGALIVIVFYYI